MARQDPQLKVRLPKEVKAFLDAETIANASSLNSEVVRAIRAAMTAREVVVQIAAADEAPGKIVHDERVNAEDQSDD